MSAEPAPPPVGAARQTLGILGGLGFTAVMHVIALVITMVIGSIFSKDEALLGWFFGFFFVIGLAQWVYVVPAALISRRMGLRYLALGFWIGGALGTLLTALCWGTIGVGALGGLVGNFLPRPAATAPPPVTQSPVRVIHGTITEVQGERIWVKDDQAGVLVVELYPGMEIVFLKKGGGYTKGDRSLVVPGARVVVDTEPAGDVLSALVFRVEQAEDASPAPSPVD